MSTTEDRTSDTKLEVLVIPVSDAEHAKAFYGGLGWRLDAADPDWPDWYAAYMVAAQAGTELPS